MMGLDLKDINEVVAVILLIVATGLLTNALFFPILKRASNANEVWLRHPQKYGLLPCYDRGR